MDDEIYTSEQAATIGAGAALSNAIDMSPLLSGLGLIFVPNPWTAAAIGFQVSSTQAGTFSPLYTETGALVQITGIAVGAAGWYKVPAEVAGAQWIKLWSQNGGVAANQAASRALLLAAKG